MNKWYRSCGWMLVAAMAIPLSGCAQQRSWLSSFSQRDKDDQKLVEVDGEKTPKTATAKKKPGGSLHKDSTDKSSESQLAKKSPAKPKASSKDPSRTEVASAKESAAARTARNSKEPLDPFLAEELEALESKGKIASKKVETKADSARKSVAAVDPFAEPEPESEIAQTSARGAQKRETDPSSVSERASSVREAAHKVEDDLAELTDLPEWALEGEAARASQK